MSGEAFAFGKNWQAFIDKHLNAEAVEEAERSLRDFLRTDSLKGRSFVDVGCGSGLFSLAAYRLGASPIISLDIDPFSVKCCTHLRAKEGTPADWQVIEGSVLDEQIVSELGRFDIVYSWGVLHHTGDMWKAMENTVQLVDEEGLLYIAIYNKTKSIGFHPDGRFGPSSFWVKEKKFYSGLPSFFQNMIDYTVIIVLVAGYLLTFRNPVKQIRGHRELRGMSWRIDIKDWLGGHPYEYAAVDEVFDFVKKYGFSLENLKSAGGLRNNEFLFKKLPVKKTSRRRKNG